MNFKFFYAFFHHMFSLFIVTETFEGLSWSVHLTSFDTCSAFLCSDVTDLAYLRELARAACVLFLCKHLTEIGALFTRRFLFY